jgi:hypothetical protein
LEGGRIVAEIRFCTTPDGPRIASAVHRHGPPLVRVATWLTHLMARPAELARRVWNKAGGEVVTFDGWLRWWQVPPISPACRPQHNKAGAACQAGGWTSWGGEWLWT